MITPHNLGIYVTIRSLTYEQMFDDRPKPS